MKDTQMETDMKEISIKEKLMVKEFILGSMVKYMMETGYKEVKMDTEDGRVLKVMSTKEIGAITNAGDMGFTNGLTEISMKEIIEWEINMDTVIFNGLTAAATKENS